MTKSCSKIYLGVFVSLGKKKGEISDVSEPDGGPADVAGLANAAINAVYVCRFFREPFESLGHSLVGAEIVRVRFLISANRFQNHAEFDEKKIKEKKKIIEEHCAASPAVAEAFHASRRSRAPEPRQDVFFLGFSLSRFVQGERAGPCW